MIGTGGPAAQAADDLDAVHVGQAEVEHDEVGPAGRPAARRARRAVGGHVDVVSAGAQVDPQGAQDLRLVVDDQDAGHGRSLTVRRPVVEALDDGAVGQRAWPASSLAATGGLRRRAGVSTMVSPPPGVVSGIRVPPMASARPRDSARPRPTPVLVVPVAEPLERQEHLVALVVGDAGAVVDDAQLDPVAVLAGGDQRRPVGRAEPQRVADDVDQDALQQAGVGRDGGQVVGDAHADVPAGLAELVERGRDRVLQPDRGGGDAERAGLQPAHVEQVLDQPGQPVERLVGGGEQLVAVLVGEVDVLGCAGWRRRPWPRRAGCAGRG